MTGKGAHAGSGGTADHSRARSYEGESLAPKHLSNALLPNPGLIRSAMQPLSSTQKDWMMQVKAYTLAIVCCALFGGLAQAESGLASVYGNGDGYAGRKTASGARMNPHALTAAHRTLPFGSRVQITNRKNGRSAIVRISDRGPFVRGRIIDVTPAAARALGFSGLAPVTVSRVNG
jgi:rare lipoprotein A